MNGNEFIHELSSQINAIKYMGECASSWGTSWATYVECDKKLYNFLKANKLNITACLEAYGINHNWQSVDDIYNDFLELYDVGDYDECLMILTHNHTSWKSRKALEKINIHLFK